MIIILHLVFICVLISFMGCEGEKGPTGPGADSSDSCGSCHNVSTDILAKQVQYEASVHATGGHGGYGTRDSCSHCHSHEGFEAALATGEKGLIFENSTPPNCRTCHNIHKNYDETDYALSTTAAVAIISPLAGDTPLTIDIGKGNLCANCHQSRDRGYEIAVGGSDFEIPGHFGPHHGPQSNVLVGFGGVEITGSESYTNSAHTTAVTNGCVTCHMAENYRNQSGGHTFNVNETGCVACHADIDDLEDYRGAQDEISELFDELAVLLVADSLLVLDDDDPEDLLESEANEDKIASSAQAGALLNLWLLLEDKSLGIHNYKYTKALLTNSIEALE